VTAGLAQVPQIPEAVLTQTMLVLDGLGTLAFALSGGLLGVRRRFDLFGVLLLAFVVAVAGGMMRDVLIGAVPPVAITEVRYVAIAVAGGLITFYWAPQVAQWHRSVLLLDAIGLGLFAVVGTQRAIAYGIHPAMATLIGMLTGIGGGVVRDVLAGVRPFVLRGELYAIAALAGGAVVAVGHVAGGSRTLFALLGAAVCIVLRLLAMFRGWHAPLPRAAGDGESP
jgi:uncharacterized membrane protein YeiH